MTETTIKYGPSLHAFEQWRKSPQACLTGFSGPDSTTLCKFTSEAKLKDYFRVPGRLEAILEEAVNAQHRSDVDVAYIRDHYFRSFAILLCIGAGDFIWHFSHYESLRDEKLPHHVQPAEFPSFPPDLFTSFKSAQWQFCPPRFYSGMRNHFSEDEILPMIRKVKIGTGGTAEVYRIVLDEEYNFLRPSLEGIGPSQSTTFVLKTFTTIEAMKDYERECQAYSILKRVSQPARHIVTCYGGFTHGNSYNMIFEYADMGTLEDFMQKRDPPASVEDVLLLWDRLSVILSGVATLHGHVEGKASASQHFHGLHQDLKPSNILVLSGDTEGPWDVHFKVADLGLATLKPCNELGEEILELDACGARSYGAPETFRSNEDDWLIPKKIGQAADMWSLGCILSEAAVWIQYGKPRLGEYRRQRREELGKVNYGEEEECFHFEGKVLSVVSAAHDNICGGILASHQITRLVVDGVVKDLLQEEERLNAGFAFQKVKRLVTQVSNKFDVKLSRKEDEIGSVRLASLNTSLPSTASFTQSPTSVPTRSTPLAVEDSGLSMNGIPKGDAPHSPGTPTLPKNENPIEFPTEPLKAVRNDESRVRQQAQPETSVSVNYILEWKNKRRKIDLPGSQHLNYLGKRDHIFIVDNSGSMENHYVLLRDTVTALTYLLKGSDDDGIDLMFTQSQQRINSSKSTNFANAISRQKFFGQSDMHAVLSNIFQEHIEKFGTMIQPPRKFWFARPPSYPQRPLTFYVLTDGKWIDGDVGALIRRMVQQMMEKRYRKEHVAIQFIRFGHDPEGKARLEDLDDGLGLKEIGMDIVDHTFWNSNVWKLLLGGQLSRFDNASSPQEEPTT